MKRITLRQKLRYSFDNIMSKGTIALISWLGIIFASIIILAALVLYVFQITPEGMEEIGFLDASWRSLMRTLDPGTMGGDEGWGFRFVAFAVTLSGIFILSVLIGILNNGIESKLIQLRKGRSFVIEKNHTLILGWSSKIFTIIPELLTANENQSKPVIVILAEKDKADMDDEIRERIPDTKNTRIICRSGNPNDMSDIGIVNPQDAKSIIVLTDETTNTDSQTIKAILALTNHPERREHPYHIVAEIKKRSNYEIAKMVGKDETELILSDDIISRIMTQTSRQSGLSIVYTELMDFEGAEIYFKEEPGVAGNTYGDSLFRYKDSAVIGLQKAGGEVLINPPSEHVIEKGDKIIAITEDDDTLVLDSARDYKINTAAIVNSEQDFNKPESTLMLGWNLRAKIIIKEMDNYVFKESVMKVVSSFDIPEAERTEVTSGLENLSVEFIIADTTKKSVIDHLNVASYDHILLLCYKEKLKLQEADSHTLVTLLHLRRISDETGAHLSIISEMLDIKNRELAEVTKADDFIVSDKLISLLMTQVSENKHLMRVFEILLNSEGSEIYLKPVKNYVKTGIPLDFYTVIESAGQKSETAIGYRIASEAFNSRKAYGVKVNPVKTDIVTFSDADRIIVLAEN
jgi:ion channel POLLUX/CASTOR